MPLNGTLREGWAKPGHPRLSRRPLCKSLPGVPELNINGGASAVPIDPARDDFATVIKRLRAAAKYSQKAMAKALDVSPQYVCDLEMSRRLGSVQIVEAIRDHFGACPEWRKLFHRVTARGHGWDV